MAGLEVLSLLKNIKSYLFFNEPKLQNNTKYDINTFKQICKTTCTVETYLPSGHKLQT